MRIAILNAFVRYIHKLVGRRVRWNESAKLCNKSVVQGMNAGVEKQCTGGENVTFSNPCSEFTL